MWTTVALIAVASMIVASLMEIIKYKVYDNEAKTKKNGLTRTLILGFDYTCNLFWI